jgi:P27 family predicted phage terminase small subunit
VSAQAATAADGWSKPTPNLERGCPEPPADLGAESQRIVPGLNRLGMLKPEDYAALVQHCQTWQTYITAIRQVHAQGITVTNPRQVARVRIRRSVLRKPLAHSCLRRAASSG